ncbi:hypothetical protein D3C85_1700590 [compost metagenome]
MAIIAHHEDLSLSDSRRSKIPIFNKRIRIRLCDLIAVHIESPFSALYFISCDRNDPFDQ